MPVGNNRLFNRNQFTSRYWSFVVYIAGLLMTIMVSIISYQSEDESAKTDFTLTTDKMTAEIVSRFKYYQFGLSGASSLWAVRNGSVSRQEWHSYAQVRDYFAEFTGTQGWGFIEAVHGNAIESFNKEAPSDFKINKSASEEIAAIKYAEPLDAAAELLGKNLLEEYATKGTLEESRLTGVATISRQFMTHQNNKSIPTYLLIYPVYKGSVKPKRFADRLQNHIGWVFAALDISAILEGVGHFGSSQIGIEIFEGRILDQLTKVYEYPPNPNGLLSHTSFKAENYANKEIYSIIPTTIVGQDFTIVYSSTPAFTASHTYVKTWLIFGICMVIAHFAFYVIYSSTKTKIRAEAIALQMTQELHVQSQALADALFGAQNSEQQVRAIVDAIPGVVFWIGKDLIIRGHNTELATLLNTDTVQLIGEEPYSCTELYDFYPKIHALFQSNETQQSCEISMKFNDHVRNYFAILKKFNSDKSVVVIALDITEQKRLEKEVEISKAKAANASRLSSLGEMAGGIAHEINNPLAIIRMKAQQLLRAIDPNSPHANQAKESIAKITSTTDRIDKIIRGLRTIARDGEGDPFVACSADKIVTDAIELTSARVANKGVELIVGKIPPNIKIKARETQVVQVLLNLINNAFDATANNQEKWIKVDVELVRRNVRFVVTDSGKGIPKEIKEKIMQPFFTTKEFGKGTGLGLSISKGIAQSHGGELLLDESTGHTRFILEIPQVVEAGNSTASDPSAA